MLASRNLNMDNPNNINVQFDIDSLANNPLFNFLNVFDTEDDVFFSNTDGTNNSPYNVHDINCDYSALPNNFVIDSDLSILSINVQSINAKFSDLLDFLSNFSSDSYLDVICLQELWQFPSNVEFKLPGYSPLVYKLRSNNVNGGGVGIYVKSNIEFSVEPVLSIFHDRVFESIVIEITNQAGNKILVGSVYRPGTKHPTLNFPEQNEIFMDTLSNVLSNINDKNIRAYMLGDLNLDVLKYNHCTLVTDYIDTLFSLGFIQIVTKPTRCTGNSATLIDHCITNNVEDKHSSVIFTTSISDHFPVLCCVSKFKLEEADIFVEGKNFSDENVLSFGNNFASLNWELFYSLNCPQEAFDLFSENFFTLYNLHFPTIRKKFNAKFHRKEPWFTQGLLISRRTKMKLDYKASRSQKPVDRDNFKKYRNVYNKTVRQAKKMYYEVQLNRSKANLRKTWALIRAAAKLKSKKNNKTLCPGLLVDGHLISDPVSMADSFNQYFVTEPSVIVGNIPPSPPSAPGAGPSSAIGGGPGAASGGCGSSV